MDFFSTILQINDPFLSNHESTTLGTTQALTLLRILAITFNVVMREKSTAMFSVKASHENARLAPTEIAFSKHSA